MASTSTTTAGQALHTLALGGRANSVHRTPPRPTPTTTRQVNINVRLRVRAVAREGPSRRQRAPPGVDTRIHWDNEDEGWLGRSTASTSSNPNQAQEAQKNLLGEKFADLLNQSTDSHYQ